MAVNKNFVVKNGLEVRQDLILADATNTTVGIGTSVPQYTLDVAGGIGVTNIYVAGFSTFIGVSTHTGQSFFNDVQVSGAGTVTGDLTVGGDLNVTGDLTYDEVTGRNLKITGLSTFVGISTFESDVYIGGDLNVVGDIVYDEVTGRNIYISGLSTFVGFSTFQNDVYVAGVVTATKFYGDGSELTNVVATSGGAIGIQSGSTYIGSGVTTLNISQTGSLTISTPSSGFTTVSLPAPGVSLGLAIALGG